MSKTWFITGGMGFIGSALVQRLLLDEQNNIIIYDSLVEQSSMPASIVSRMGSPESGKGVQAKLIVGDILDYDLLSKSCSQASVIVHLAANTGVAPSVEDPKSDCRTNVLGTLNVLEAARASSCSRVVFASSGAPLGDQTPPLHEELAPHPASPYGASKLAGEAYCSAYFHAFGLHTTALRFGNVYGPGSWHKGSVVAKFIKEALAGAAWEIYGDGSQTRDFIFIDDLVNAILTSASADTSGGEVFQIATSKETTVQNLSLVLSELLAESGYLRTQIQFTSKRAGDVERNYSDTSKAREKLGWEATTTLREGLARTLSFFLEEQKQQ